MKDLNAPERAGDELRAHLKAVHEEAAGFTESCASACVDETGRNSYAWISEAISPPANGRVLDLACGSGVLLEICRRRFGADLALAGLDMSAAELALSARRLGQHNVDLHEGLAQSLSFAETASFDAVLCHWALTLMDPLAPVLDEVARVLRPGGVFAAIVDGPVDSAAGYGEICALIGAHVRQAAPDYAELGDPRARTADALEALVGERCPGAHIEVESRVFALEAAPAVLARETAGFFYSSFMLTPDQRAPMLAELTQFFAAQDRPRYEMPVNRLRVMMAGEA